MKTIRTVLFTLAGVLLAYGLFALISLSTEAALVERTLYQMFTRTNFVALVMGAAFLLIAIILTIALFAFKEDVGDSEEDEEDDEADEDEFDPAELDLVAPVALRSERPIRPSRPAAIPDDEEMLPTLFSDDSEDEAVEPEELYRRPEPVKREERPQPEIKPETPQPEAEREPEPETMAQRFCIFCGAKIAEESLFCPFCGKRL
ncbi:MAG: zinc ribbon domain-containing protein [Clostridia bacterium]|nr:zinc ribbon domain-containing protein [Clostridia bacterium]